MPAPTATTTTTLTVHAANFRYSLMVESRTPGVYGGKLILRRAQYTANPANANAPGTWVDDPTPGAGQTVPIPPALTPALDGIFALLPQVLTALKVTGTPSATRMHIAGVLNADGTQRLSIVLQLLITGRWQIASIADLNIFLGLAAPDPNAKPAPVVAAAMAAPVAAAWAALDTEVNALNASNKWV